MNDDIDCNLMDDEVLVKKIEEELIEISPVEQGIFLAYLKLPEAMREELSFDCYYDFHRRFLEVRLEKVDLDL